MHVRVNSRCVVSEGTGGACHVRRRGRDGKTKKKIGGQKQQQALHLSSRHIQQVFDRITARLLAVVGAGLPPQVKKDNPSLPRSDSSQCRNATAVE